jgi:peptidase M48-like protein/SH3 domain-containing protein
MRTSLIGLFTAVLVSTGAAAELAGVVIKPTIDVYAEPSFESPKISTLKRDAEVTVSAQQGLWYALQLAAGGTGYVRVNDLRMKYGSVEEGDANLRALTSGKAGVGRVTETAGVRGIDESDLKSASFSQAQFDAMVANRVDAGVAATHAGGQHWEVTTVAYASEAKPRKDSGKAAGSSASGAESTSAVKNILGSFSSGVSSVFGTAAKVAPKSEAEQSAEEIALGPQIAGRILGARPLWNDAGAQQRVNLIGRWVASQTSRPELPWTFGVIDSPEINAFAAPGGYVLVTRGMYEILATDGEVAAVLGHEISHCVQRDHYNVIRKQELATTGKDLAMSEVQTGTDSVAGNYARQYAEKHGAAIMLTALDREAEYRADEAAEVYAARAGMNPVSLYAVLQKMTAAGTQSASLAQLYKTHPALDDRMDRIDRRDYKALKAYTTRD